MPETHLSAGTIEYGDTGGEGPPVVLLHGLAMNGSVWREVVPGLRDAYRCLTPTLPLGAHRIPMRPDADLTVLGVARLVAEFLEKLELRDATLVLNDWGGAQALVADGRDERIARLVLTSCEAFENYPPGLPGRGVTLMVKVPGALGLGLQLLRHPFAQRSPLTLGWMTRRPLPTDLAAAWFGPASASSLIRRDLRKYALSVPPDAELRRWSEALAGFPGPALVAWAAGDRVMPPEHGRRLAALLPDARHVEIEDSRVLLPLDRPDALTETLRTFLAETADRAHRG